MGLKQFAKLMWQWSWLMVVAALAFGAVAYVISLQMVPIYEATTTLLINQAPANSASVDLNSLRTSEGLAKTYAEIMPRRPLFEAVIANLKLNMDPGEFARHVNVSVVRESPQLIVLTVDDPNPQRAADMANEMVRVFSQQIKDLQTGRYKVSKDSLQRELDEIQADIANLQAKLDTLGTPASPEELAEQSQLQTLLAQQRNNHATLFKSLEDVRLAEAQSTDTPYVVEPAQAANEPVFPRTRLNTLLAALVGAMLAGGFVFLISYLDDSIKSGEQVEALTGVPPLATIARIKGSDLPVKLITATDARSPIAEAYRLLRTNIEFSAVDKPIRTIVVTSSGPVEGKTLTSANLAVVIAQSGKRVILVDTDLRRPMLHGFFHQTSLRGLTTALLGQRQGAMDEYLVSTGIENLRLMPSGPIPPNPAELLGSARMVEVMDKLKAEADVLLFDSPPVLAVADASLLARVCDATLLVVLAGGTRAEELKRAKEQLAQSGARLLGVVLNRASDLYGGYYHYHYERREKKTTLAGLWRRAPFGRITNRKSLGETPSAQAPNVGKGTIG
jgi:capsular exopolysaccharide synthesis family protein